MPYTHPTGKYPVITAAWLPVSLHADLQKIAARDHTSLSSTLRRLLSSAIRFELGDGR
jgi:hypothetical protein